MGAISSQAGDSALDSLEPLLAEVRRHSALKEKKRGVSYRRSAAFLPFHEDPSGLFADLRTAGGWARLPVNTASERQFLLSRIAGEVACRCARHLVGTAKAACGRRQHPRCLSIMPGPTGSGWHGRLRSCRPAAIVLAGGYGRER